MNILGTLVAFIEWYDAAICIAFANILYQVFFPNLNNLAGFNIALATLSISCIGKPIGAYLIGRYSDNNNRIKAAFYSLLTMSILSLVIAILPSYNSLGKVSASLFLLFKFLQGIAIGGNYSASVYSLEESKEKYFVSSLTSFAIFMAFFLANFYNNICVCYCSPKFNFMFAWRLGLIASFVFSLPVLVLFKIKLISQPTPKEKTEINVLNHAKTSLTLSQSLKEFAKKSFKNLISLFKFKTQRNQIEGEKTSLSLETSRKQHFLSYIYTQIASLVLFDLKTTVLTFLFSQDEDENFTQKELQYLIKFRNFMKACFLVLLDIVPFQYFHVFLPNYKIMILGLDQTSVRWGTLITLLTITITTPIIGKLADKFGGGTFLKLSALMMIASSSFNYFNFNKILSQLHLNDIYFGLMMSLCYATLYCYLPLKFQKSHRAQFSGFALNLTTSIVLIAMPILSTAIEAYIQIIMGFIGVIALHILVEDRNLTEREMKHRKEHEN